MIQVALYVNTKSYSIDAPDVDSWARIDMDRTVNVILNDAIKDAKDVGKVLTAYSQNFKVPASKTNNKAFRYFYSHNALNGFDARRKHEAIIKVNGYDFKKGYIKLNNVSLSDNKPISYDIQFFGELASLKDILGQDELKELMSLNQFNHEYSQAVVKDGFEAGLSFDFTDAREPVITKDVNGDIRYGLISHTRGFEYDNDGFHRIFSVEERAAGRVPTPADRIRYPDLKPSIRVTRIIEGIEAQYPQIKFNKEWMQNSKFNDLFMWLHRTKGYVQYDQFALGENSHQWNGTLGAEGSPSTEIPFVSGSAGDLIPFRTQQGSTGQSSTRQTYEIRFYCTAIGTGSYKLKLRTRRYGSLKYESPWSEFSAGTGSHGIDAIMATPWGDGWNIEFVVDADLTVVNIDPQVIITRVYGDPNTTAIEDTADYNYGGVIPLTNKIIVPALMPKKKTVDFLSDLFKMFNLVAYEERNLDNSWAIKIEPLDDFYAAGTSYDITPYIDITDTSVGRVSPYGSIDFAWPDPKTFLAINQAEIVGDEFGTARFRASYFDEGAGGDTTLLYDGGNYSVEPKLEKMMFERMNDADNKEILTDIQWGWFVNDNKENVPEPTIGQPLLTFFVNHTLTDGREIEWTDGSISLAYNRPSSVSEDGLLTLHFNAENDEWTREVNSNSLFSTYHDTYISGIYSPYARRVTCDAYLPAIMFLKIQLKDSLLINNVPFIIDTIKTNMTTGKSQLELLRITDEEIVYEMPTESEVVWDTERLLWNDNEQLWEGGAIPVNPLTTNLVASYNFDADFTDYTGNNPLTPSGGTPPVAGVAGGVVSNCAEFNNTSDHTLAADSDDFSFTDGVTDLPFSVSFWANFTGYNSSVSQGVWFLSKRDASTNEEYQIQVFQNVFNISLFSGGGGANYLNAGLAYPPPIGSWHHYTVTYDGSETSAGIKLYIDGVSQALTYSIAGTYTGMINGSKAINIGSRSWQPNGGSFYGKLDETHIWKDRELTAAEVMYIYTTELAGNSIL